MRERSNLLASIEQLKLECAELETQKSEATASLEDTKRVEFEYTESIKTMQNAEIEQVKYYYSLYSKYKYVLDFKQKNTGSDFGLQELVYQNEISKKTKAPTALMLALYETESTFNSKAQSSLSTATGYGQIIDSTAKSIYENMLSRGIYDRSKHRFLSTNKKLNMDMSTAYISRNIEVYGGARAAVEAYYGHKDASERRRYSDVINSKLRNYGYTLENVCSN